MRLFTFFASRSGQSAFSKMSDSSSISEDENAKFLREAADKTLISDELFKSGPEKEDAARLSAEEATMSRSKGPPKSERYLEGSEHHTDLDIPNSMRDFVYKRLSANIDSLVEFVEVAEKPQKKKRKKEKAVVKLLSDTGPIEHIEQPVEVSFDFPIIKKRKPQIKRRQVDGDLYSDDDKLRISAVESKSILDGDETRRWKTKETRPHKMFEYHEKNNVLYFVEPKNEFSAQRKKNNWTESKISKWRKSR